MSTKRDLSITCHPTYSNIQQMLILCPGGFLFRASSLLLSPRVSQFVSGLGIIFLSAEQLMSRGLSSLFPLMFQHFMPSSSSTHGYRNILSLLSSLSGYDWNTRSQHKLNESSVGPISSRWRLDLQTLIRTQKHSFLLGKKVCSTKTINDSSHLKNRTKCACKLGTFIVNYWGMHNEQFHNFLEIYKWI